MHVLDYFEQVYVINLPHRLDRRREMAGQLEKIGLGFDTPGVRLFEAVRPEDAGEFPSIGARGCFFSHLGVLRDAREKKFDRVMIFEDDLNFEADFKDRMPEVVASLKLRDWSMFYGGYDMQVPPAPGQEPVVQASSGDAIRTTHFVGFRGAAIPEAVSYLETMLTRPAGDPKPGPMHVDGAYGWFRHDHPSKITLLAAPQLGYQRSSATDIHAHRWFDRLPGARQATSWLRRLRNTAKR